MLEIYKPLFEALSLDSQAATFYWLVFIARRMFLLVVAVSLHQYPVFQAFLFAESSFATLFYLMVAHPLREREANNFEVANEIGVWIIGCLSLWLCSSNFGYLIQQAYANTLLLNYIRLNLALNMLYILNTNIRQLCRMGKRWWYKR